MVTPCRPDEVLREAIAAYREFGNYSAAGRELGVDPSTVRRRVAEGLERGLDCPPGHMVKGTSTLYDADGNVRLTWVKSAVDKEEQERLFREALDALTATIEPLPKSKPPKQANASLMSLYPVGDHHIGMLSWDEETGANYDTDISEKLLISAMDYLVDASPASSVGVVLLIGDFLHYDSYESITPQSKHQLDADSRYPRIVRAAMTTVRYAVDKALTKHARVKVVVVAGNHDPSSMVFLREALWHLYEKEPRIEVDRSPKVFQYVRHGKCLLGAHHGDKVKADKLPLLMATDCKQDWGETEHRYIFTGHVHHDHVKDHPGARVESVRILPPQDAWAYGAGYRSARDMKRIDFHAEYGEVCRQLVTPEMCA